MTPLTAIQASIAPRYQSTLILSNAQIKKLPTDQVLEVVTTPLANQLIVMEQCFVIVKRGVAADASTTIYTNIVDGAYLVFGYNVTGDPDDFDEYSQYIVDDSGAAPVALSALTQLLTNTGSSLYAVTQVGPWRPDASDNWGVPSVQQTNIVGKNFGLKLGEGSGDFNGGHIHTTMNITVSYHVLDL